VFGVAATTDQRSAACDWSVASTPLRATDHEDVSGDEAGT
jgi:hypothetical protein